MKELEREVYLPFIGTMSFADVNVAYVKYTLPCFIKTMNTSKHFDVFESFSTFLKKSSKYMKIQIYN